MAELNSKWNTTQRNRFLATLIALALLATSVLLAISGDGSVAPKQQSKQLNTASALSNQWQAPWLPRQADQADGVPEAMKPLIELQQNPPRDPFTINAKPGPELYIMDPESLVMAPHERQLLELLNGDADPFLRMPPLEIRLRIPEGPPDTEIERFQMEAQPRSRNTNAAELMQ